MIYGSVCSGIEAATVAWHPFEWRPAKDGPRYRVIGNSMAVNVMRWIGERIESVEHL
jgi:site-specific DNA-cytosine methylase